MTIFDPAILPLHQAAGKIEAGELSSEELVQALLARIEHRDGEVHAWTHLDAEALLARAREIDAGPRLGPLHGVPIAIKDIYDTADMPTQLGSPIYADRQPERDATSVARLREAGALIMGKTVTTEFAYMTPGATTNPHNAGHTPGGSSSGSAAAVADYQAPAALGSQTAGSVLRPASYCGVVGYKPAFGEIPETGVHPFAPSLDTMGMFVRDLADLPLLSSVLRGHPPQPQAEVAIVDPSLPPRFALFRTQHWEKADEAARTLLEDVAHRLAQAGGRLRDMDVPPGFTDLDRAQKAIMESECATVHTNHWRDNRDLLSEPLRDIIERGQKVPEAEISAAQETAAKWRAALPTLMEPGEMILTLSSPGEAPVGIGSTGWAIFNLLWTLLHVPAISLPAGTGPQGLPIGVQIVVPSNDEPDLLAAAAWAAKALDLPVL